MWVDFGGAGYYVQFSADGMLLGAGAYQPDKADSPTLPRARCTTPAGEAKGAKAHRQRGEEGSAPQHRVAARSQCHVATSKDRPSG
jgi:hypothetical protein